MCTLFAHERERIGCITPVAGGIPNAAKRGTKVVCQRKNDALDRDPDNVGLMYILCRGVGERAAVAMPCPPGIAKSQGRGGQRLFPKDATEQLAFENFILSTAKMFGEEGGWGRGYPSAIHTPAPVRTSYGHGRIGEFQVSCPVKQMTTPRLLLP